MKRKPLLLAAAILLAHQPELAAQGPADDISAGQSAPPAALPPANGKIEEIAVIGRFIPDEKRTTAAISNVLDTEALRRAGDSNVGEGLKRLAGLNLSEGKFIFIRGLGERYSSSILNGSMLPSPEPLQRAVPLDLFPSSIIDSVLVQKTYTPAYPAEFAGGTVAMRTKVAPEQPFFELSSSIGVNGNTSFRKGLTYDGGGTDWLGIDDGTRDIPDPIKDAIAGDKRLRKNSLVFRDGVSAEELEVLGESLPNKYAVRSESIDPDVSLGATFGTRYEAGQAVFGVLSNLSYSNSWQSQDVVRNSTRVVKIDGEDQVALADRQVFDFTEQTIDESMFLSAGMDYANTHTLKTTLLKIHKSDDQASLLTGFLATEATQIRQARLELIERDMFSWQVEGEHTFFDWNELTLNWHFNESQAKREAPGMRQYRFDLDPRSEQFLFSVRADSNQRTWSYLEDDNQDLGASAKVFLDGPFNASAQLSFGFTRVRKDRDSQIRRFTFSPQGPAANDVSVRSLPLEQILAPENIGPDGFELRESTRPTDTYTAKQNLDAWFVEADMELGPVFRLLAGLRKEKSDQDITTFDLFSPGNAPIVSDLKSSDIFPVVTGTWVWDEKNMQFRLGYSETISRPDFRELSPSPFTHPVLGFEIIGNPDLTMAKIDNYDFRWEWYFSDSESLSLGAFYKTFDSPIEAVIEPGPANRRTWINADDAEVYGFEIDGFIWLDRLHRALGNWFVSSNFSWVDSKVNIRPEVSGILTNQTRRLQGQADFIFNLQAGYDDGFRQKATLAYNLTGEKIREVGVLGAPDVMDDAYGELDFNYIRYLTDNLTVNLKGRNLLNTRRETTQGGLIVNALKENRTFSLSVNYDF